MWYFLKNDCTTIQAIVPFYMFPKTNVFGTQKNLFSAIMYSTQFNICIGIQGQFGRFEVVARYLKCVYVLRYVMQIDILLRIYPSSKVESWCSQWYTAQKPMCFIADILCCVFVSVICSHSHNNIHI